MSELQALAAIDSADLPAPVYRTARKLLDRADPLNGFVRLPPDTMRDLAATQADGTMRRHLIDLKRAGIIHYSINGDVAIWFAAWPTMITQTREMIVETREMINPRSFAPANDEPSPSPTPDPRAPGDHLTRPGAREIAQNDHLARQNDHSLIRGDLVGRLVDPSDLDKEELPTQLPTRPSERDLSERLLVKIGIAPKTATPLAAKHPFEFVRRAVAQWWMGRKSQGGPYEEQPGIVAYWLNNPDKAGIGPIPSRFTYTDLWREFRLPEELAGEIVEPSREVEFYAAPTQEPSPAPKPKPPAPDPADPWPVMVMECKSRVSSDAIRGWLEAARLVHLDDVDGVAQYEVILPPDADARSVESRCLRVLRFSLGSILELARPPLLTFVVAESEAPA